MDPKARVLAKAKDEVLAWIATAKKLELDVNKLESALTEKIDLYNTLKHKHKWMPADRLSSAQLGLTKLQAPQYSTM